MKKYYTINMRKVIEQFNDLDPHEVSMLIVVSEFHRPITEEEAWEKFKEYGLDKMSDEEIMKWLDEWRKKKAPMFLN